MKRGLCLAGCFLGVVLSVSAAEDGMKNDSIVHDTLIINDKGELSRYDRRVLKYREHWDLLIPTNGVIQTCGNMGVISLGIGWDYGKRRQWETFVMLGYIPRFDSDESKITLTLKENFIPWRRDIGKGWWFEQLECSIYFNTIFGHDFWTCLLYTSPSPRDS